jgi:hypothetical protein
MDTSRLEEPQRRRPRTESIQLHRRRADPTESRRSRARPRTDGQRDLLWHALGNAQWYTQAVLAVVNSQLDRFANLLKQATQAVRKTCPSAKIILHVERVSLSQQRDNKDYKALTNFFSKMNTYGIDYDVIGLSYYPYFHGALSELDGAITKLETAYPGKDIMVVETGYPYAWAVGGSTYDATKVWPYSDEGQKQFTDDLIAMLNKHSKVDRTLLVVAGIQCLWHEPRRMVQRPALRQPYRTRHLCRIILEELLVDVGRHQGDRKQWSL